MTKITELAHLIRSRKLGQMAFEVDIIFKDFGGYKKVVEKGVVTKEIVAKLYDVPESHITVFETSDIGKLIHFAILRPQGRASGDPGETDVSGGLQYFPIIQLEV